MTDHFSSTKPSIFQYCKLNSARIITIFIWNDTKYVDSKQAGDNNKSANIIFLYNRDAV